MTIKKVGYWKVLLFVFLLNAILVTTHKGEFWPFSIYPMFSQAGKPWERALLIDVTNAPDSIIWKTYNYPEFPGEVASTISLGIDNIDFSNFVCKTKDWNKKRLRALRYMLSEEKIKGRKLLVVKVRGVLLSDTGIEAKAIPFILLQPSGNYFNPTLSKSIYFEDENN